ncbi:M1 family metallopeptidase [Paenibacillus sp. LHD-117]|uniref:M1 family metallopeptidase n=1 Tax=Paenibacillus sp. LHD-117 TaxID=3071412 RepID=UPI0027DF6287|nr:M1 family metallopeptidase [Paenibacillus sp. LHD-117]MDQ6420158.1 M1 family metallopeptidase [Paenibacillus sp. LHD-117]
MTPRNVKRLLFGLLAAALLAISVQFGFGNAWQSQYTYAFAPAAKAPNASPPAANSAKPQAVQQPDKTLPPQPQSLSKRVVEYHISVSLREDGQHLDGEQDVTWTNPGRKPVSELYFHLYPNAFQSAKTTFMTESGGKLRQDKATLNSRSHIELLSLQTLEGESLLPRLQYMQPDDGNTNDYTLVRLRLPEAVAPGKSVTLKMNFEVKLPEVFARMGYSGDFVMAGQWFPKLAVYETVGMRGRTSEGWNVHQYHGNSEFYSDFGIYSVRIDVPESHVVAATGFQTKPIVTNEGRKVFQFYAEDVHDFAWAASPDFVYEETAYSDKGIPGVRIKLYLDPLHADLKDRYFHAAKSALANYAKWYGSYPYNTLSIVVPPDGANGAGGMEYPTLVTAFAAISPNPGYDLERTVVHEIGHQYWYGMVASNEFEEAWLDEGFTSYAEDKVMEAAYGITPNLRLEASYMTDPAPLKQPSWAYADSNQYAENVYMRAKLVLIDIENKVGDKLMERILRIYFQKYKFKHPTTGDFQRVIEQVTKAKWTDYFNQYVYSNRTADVSVEAIGVKPIDQDGAVAYESTVLIQRNGGLTGPVPIVLRFADGTTLTKEWSDTETHIQFTEVSNFPLQSVTVDPNQTNVLDNKLINNFMLAELPSESRTRWSLAAIKLVEGILGAISW